MSRSIPLRVAVPALTFIAIAVSSGCSSGEKPVVPEKKKTLSSAELYRTAGGIYTAADIQVNGDLPAMEKFKGMVHNDESAKPGDKICPISEKKVNAECFWVVNGQRYEFCCPPCVNSFLKLAHNEPEKVKDAGAYVFKAP